MQPCGNKDNNTIDGTQVPDYWKKPIRVLDKQCQIEI